MSNELITAREFNAERKRKIGVPQIELGAYPHSFYTYT